MAHKITCFKVHKIVYAHTIPKVYILTKNQNCIFKSKYGKSEIRVT